MAFKRVYAFLGEGVFRYIGSTYLHRGDERLDEHWRESDFCKDYPTGCFITLETDIPEDLIKAREAYWIAEYQTYSDGYNGTPYYRGVFHTVESRKKLRFHI